MESAPSRTAMFAAVSRGLFRLETASPWVLDDVLALVLVGPVWQQLRERLTDREHPPDEIDRVVTHLLESKALDDARVARIYVTGARPSVRHTLLLHGVRQPQVRFMTTVPAAVELAHANIRAASLPAPSGPGPGLA